jgi:hypothetical protein
VKKAKEMTAELCRWHTKTVEGNMMKWKTWELSLHPPIWTWPDLPWPVTLSWVMNLSHTIVSFHVLILVSRLCLSLQSGLLPSCFLFKILYFPTLSCMQHALLM